MIGNALLATSAVFLAAAFWLIQECAFLAPYRDVLYREYGTGIAIWSATFFLNVFAAFYFVCRKLFLKDTGRKLAHLEKQIRTGASVSDELRRRLEGQNDL